MKKNKKQSKKNQKIKEKKNLQIANYGDVIVIRNRSVIAASVLSFIMLSLCIAGGVVMKEAWELPLFIVVFVIFVIGSVYSLANILLSKIVLDSPNMLMTVYNPFKKQYKFEDINYVDVHSSKTKDGIALHNVIVYIGNGKRNVEIITMSSKQADELVSLLRGMLENGAMVFPEGDEEPFDFDEDDKKRTGLFSFGSKKNKKSDTEDETEQLISKKNDKSEETSSVSKESTKVERKLPVFKTDIKENSSDGKTDKPESEEPKAEPIILKESVFDNEEKATPESQEEQG